MEKQAGRRALRFLQGTNVAFDMRKKTRRAWNLLMFMRQQFKAGIDGNRAKLYHFTLKYQEELKSFISEIAHSRDKSKKELIRPLTKLQANLPITLFKAIIYRCKILHSLAFFQWRYKNEPKAQKEDLKEIFEGKANFLKHSVMPLPVLKGAVTEQVIEIKAEKPGYAIFLEQVEIERHNNFSTFEEIGFQDPFAPNAKAKAEKVISQLTLGKNVYPDRLMEGPKPPKCVFVPDKALMRKLIKMQLQS